MKNWIIRDGNFTPVVRGVACFIGGAITLIGLKYDVMFVALLGFTLVAVGGISSRAAMLGIKPFENSYREARESYKKKDDAQKGKSR
ncbi:hypothetical protein KQH49_07260 [Mycetohabitans sp. B5]|uniref:hypothetical protein n=1 Tax=Mycetohabitans TaxID=2571159 RepID=UPI000CE52968|nr:MULTISPECIES: hypothetical protein [Mycetohabitans]MCG1054765.1 hypothetical protein [Mycetohabitans sp. B5]